MGPKLRDWRWRTIECAKALDHEHRRRIHSLGQGAWAHIFSLHLLRLAFRRLLSTPKKFPLQHVAHPEAGHIAVTFIGHATAMLTTHRMRVLIDPFLNEFLFGVRRLEAACLSPMDAADVRFVLISHAHPDHLHLPSLRRLPRQAVIVVPPRCASLVRHLGFSRVLELAPGESVEEGDVEITAVAARHDGRRGIWDPRWRGASGYIARSGDASVYYAGDTAYFSGFEEIGRRLHPDVALLPVTGYDPPSGRAEHMSPLDALQAFSDLGAKLLVPIGHGSFPVGYEPHDEPLTWLAHLCKERGLAERLVVLRAGETRQVHGRTAPVA